MTIRFPDRNISDKILKYLGKKRGLILPKDYSDQPGRHVYAKAIKENFWKALFRPKSVQFPENVIDYETFMEKFDKLKGG